MYNSREDFLSAITEARENIDNENALDVINQITGAGIEGNFYSERIDDKLEEITSYIDFVNVIEEVNLSQIYIKQAYIALVYHNKERSKDSLEISWNRAIYDDDSIYLQVARTRFAANPVELVYNGTKKVKGEVHRDGIHIGTQYFWVHNGYAVHVVVPAWLLELYPEETFLTCMW